jgi:hypothetical protein
MAQAPRHETTSFGMGRVPSRVRLVHKTLLDGRFHVFTSPDVVGLHASDETEAGAQRQAIAILDLLATRDGVSPPVVTFLESQDLQAA